MKTNFTILLFLGLLSSPYLLADSPITDTPFSRAYQDVKIVQTASKANGKLNVELLYYLSDSSNPIDVKVAVINEIGWDIDGKNNAPLFEQFLKVKNKMEDISAASAEDLLCLAYLKSMDDYFDVRPAIRYVNMLKSKDSKSYTIRIVMALIEAQKALTDREWYKVYRLPDAVRKNYQLEKDMRQTAVDIIFSYTDTYIEYAR